MLRKIESEISEAKNDEDLQKEIDKDTEMINILSLICTLLDPN